MSNCATDFAYANEEECFAVAEVACGTLTKPLATNRMYTLGAVDFGQERELLEDEQLRASASKMASIKARLMVGDTSFRTYVKPSGVLGTASEHDLLLKCLTGVKTTNPATSVVYTLANQLDSMTLWYKKGHSVFALRGAAVERGEFNVTGDAPGTINWTLKFMERLWAGEVAANDTCGIGKATITLAATGALRYCVGMYVTVGTDDNGGAGYLLTDVNYTNNTITISPVLVTDQGVNPTIYPWWQTGAAEVGTPVHGKLGIVTVGGQNAVVISANVSITNNLKFYDNEKNGVWTAERFGRPGHRAVEGSLSLYFLKQGLSYFYRADYLQTNALIIPVGNAAGRIMEISIPYAEYKAPGLSGGEEYMEEVRYAAIASAALNDEVSITYR